MGEFSNPHILIALLALFIALIPAFIASNKGHSFLLWVFLSIIAVFTGIGWFIVLLITIIMKPTSKGAGMRTCPSCMEAIKIKALTCKHCGKDIVKA